MAVDPELRAHRDWLGLVQPEGLLVTPHALVAAQAHVDRNVAAQQARLIEIAEERPGTRERDGHLVLPDLRRACIDLLGWEASDIQPPPAELATVLPEFGETLAPTWAVPDPDAPAGQTRWLMLIVAAPEGCDLDQPQPGTERHWHASPQARLERLLRDANVPIGLLGNGTHVRLVFAPRGETSGHATFPVAPMAEVWGRPMLAAFLMLLHADRVFGADPKRRLAAILQQSRKHQNEVSTRLSEQVLRALNELLRGTCSADEASRHALLATYKDEALDEVYEGLLTVLLRLVFVVYAEDRGLMPDDSTWARHYSVTGLFERLREDEARNPDTIDERFGAWAQLLTLFRMLHDGTSHGPRLRLPARHGRLFDPDAHPFLEERPRGVARVMGEAIDPPRISDGVVLRVLRDLLVLDEERLSYRTLDVEEIGSIYQALMGFELRVADGRSIGLKAGKKRLAIVVDLDGLLAAEPGKRAKLLEERADVKLTGKALEALKSASSVDGLMEALRRRISPTTPDTIPLGGLYLEPTEERRRSGAHYTPRSLTAPIVEATLRPIFERLGPDAKPEQVLDLKVCDPAMGSGAFLVEACRVLGERLVLSWKRHRIEPKLPPDEDLDLYARRLVAQRCLYGVDKNPMAVDLAKLSLWLATLAKDHPFTFLDHALRCGDSLVGLSRRQIEDFHWAAQEQLTAQRQLVRQAMDRAMKARQRIVALAETDATLEKEELLAESDAALADVRLIGDVVIEAFFSEDKPKARKARLVENASLVEAWLDGAGSREAVADRTARLSEPEHPVMSFHWEVEFPEVFARQIGGFDAFVGNPPFLGGKRVKTLFGPRYRDWLLECHAEASANADLVAHFFRRAFAHLRSHGVLGLIATNTIAQGYTRAAGLYAIRCLEGTILAARKRVRWPGEAAVVVSVIWIQRGHLICVYRPGRAPCGANHRIPLELWAGQRSNTARGKSTTGIHRLFHPWSGLPVRGRRRQGHTAG